MLPSTDWLLLLDHSHKVCGWLLPVYLLPSVAPPFLPSWFYPSWDLKWRTLSRISKDKRKLTRHIVNSSSQYLSSSLSLELHLLRYLSQVNNIIHLLLYIYIFINTHLSEKYYVDSAPHKKTWIRKTLLYLRNIWKTCFYWRILDPRS